ncbi:hypothetical protein [Algicola sagamiensis]|uniref:hypothetical protein n=1 Tax=Algicola sagamiensis TaxID=163869 RepID=UPI00037E5F60|nr:hypothetical protein [Algicola sagamiensis]
MNSEQLERFITEISSTVPHDISFDDLTVKLHDLNLAIKKLESHSELCIKYPWILDLANLQVDLLLKKISEFAVENKNAHSILTVSAELNKISGY